MLDWVRGSAPATARRRTPRPRRRSNLLLLNRIWSVSSSGWKRCAIGRTSVATSRIQSTPGTRPGSATGPETAGKGSHREGGATCRPASGHARGPGDADAWKGGKQQGRSSVDGSCSICADRSDWLAQPHDSSAQLVSTHLWVIVVDSAVPPPSARVRQIGASEVGTTSSQSDRTRACSRQRAACMLCWQHLHVARTEWTLRHACKREQTESKRAERQRISSGAAKKGKSSTKDEGKRIACGSGKN